MGSWRRAAYSKNCNRSYPDSAKSFSGLEASQPIVLLLTFAFLQNYMTGWKKLRARGSTMPAVVAVAAASTYSTSFESTVSLIWLCCVNCIRHCSSRLSSLKPVHFLALSLSEPAPWNRLPTCQSWSDIWSSSLRHLLLYSRFPGIFNKNPSMPLIYYICKEKYLISFLFQVRGLPGCACVIRVFRYHLLGFITRRMKTNQAIYYSYIFIKSTTYITSMMIFSKISDR